MANGSASKKPTARPIKIPRLIEFSLRATRPMIRPATRPLKVDPTMIPNIIDSVPGYRRAVSPSRIPSTVPRIIPITTLDIDFSFRCSIKRLAPAFLTFKEKKDQGAHDEVDHDQVNDELVVCDPTARFLEEIFGIGFDRFLRQETTDIEGHVLGSQIPLVLESRRCL